MKKFLFLLFLGIFETINANGTYEVSSSTDNTSTWSIYTLNYFEDMKDVIRGHAELYQKLSSGFDKLKIVKLNQTLVTVEEEEDARNLISSHFRFLRLIHNMSSMCVTNKKLYDLFKKNCSNIEPLNDTISESFTVFKCLYILKEMIGNSSEKMTNVDSEINRAMNNLTGALEKVALHIKNNNFKKMIDNEVLELKDKIKYQDNKIVEAEVGWGFISWTDTKAVQEAKNAKHELGDKVKLSKIFLDILKNYEQLTGNTETDVRNVTEKTSETLRNMKEVLKTTGEFLRDSENLFREVILNPDLQEECFGELEASVTRIFKTSCFVRNE